MVHGAELVVAKNEAASLFSVERFRTGTGVDKAAGVSCRERLALRPVFSSVILSVNSCSSDGIVNTDDLASLRCASVAFRAAGL